MTENNYNKLIDAICELVNLAWDSTSKEEFERLDNAGADIIDCIEKLQQFEAIGSVEEFKVLKVTQKMIEKSNFCLEQYRADTYTAYQCGYNKAIDEFAELMKEKLKDMQFAEFQGIDVCPCAKTGEECQYINQDIGCQYCAREQTIKEIEKIAEQLKAGGENEID